MSEQPDPATNTTIRGLKRLAKLLYREGIATRDNPARREQLSQSLLDTGCRMAELRTEPGLKTIGNAARLVPPGSDQDRACGMAFLERVVPFAKVKLPRAMALTGNELVMAHPQSAYAEICYNTFDEYGGTMMAGEPTASLRFRLSVAYSLEHGPYFRSVVSGLIDDARDMAAEAATDAAPVFAAITEVCKGDRTFEPRALAGLTRSSCRRRRRCGVDP